VKVLKIFKLSKNGGFERSLNLVEKEVLEILKLNSKNYQIQVASDQQNS